jgi:hypothetical protein
MLAILTLSFVFRSSFIVFFWRGARVVELAALEMLCTGNRTVGSNPTLSAIPIADCGFEEEEPSCFYNPKSTFRNSEGANEK